jgi:hypothetical protein
MFDTLRAPPDRTTAVRKNVPAETSGPGYGEAAHLDACFPTRDAGKTAPMTQRDETPSQPSEPRGEGRKADDRRQAVKPTDNPVPSSPPAEERAVREGEEKLERVKPY